MYCEQRRGQVVDNAAYAFDIVLNHVLFHIIEWVSSVFVRAYLVNSTNPVCVEHSELLW